MSVSILRMRNGESGIVADLPPGEAGRRLEALGLRPGKRIDRLSGMPFRGPVTVCLEGRRVAIGYGVARRVLVEPVSFDRPCPCILPEPVPSEPDER